MPERARKAYEAWQKADALAKAAEDRVHEAWKRYERFGDAPPSQEALEEVRKLRAVASEKLAIAMRLMRRTDG